MNDPLVTKNACIYANRSVRRWLKANALRKISGIENPRDDGMLFLPPEKLTFVAAGVGVTLHAKYDTYDGTEFAEHIRGFKGWCSSVHEKQSDFDLAFIHSYLDQVSQSYGVVADREFTLDSPVMKALVKIADSLDGFVFIHNSLVHGSGNVVFGMLLDIHGESEPYRVSKTS